MSFETLCVRCHALISKSVARAYYATEHGRVIRVCQGCARPARPLDNPFHELGFPEAKRDRSQNGYSWYGKD